VGGAPDLHCLAARRHADAARSPSAGRLAEHFELEPDAHLAGEGHAGSAAEVPEARRKQGSRQDRQNRLTAYAGIDGRDLGFGEQQGARSSGRGTRFDVAALLSAEPREMIEIVPRRKPGPGRRAVPQGNAKQERGENRSALPPGHRVSGPQPTTDRFSGRPSIRTTGVRIAGVCADPHRTPLLQHPTASGRRQSTGRVCVPAGRCAFETRSDLF
jgi:hypothetical protein